MAAPRAVNIIAAIAIAIMAFVALHDFVYRPDRALLKSDFAAFYCGAAVALEHRDPYALTPLRVCEATRVDIPLGADPAAVGIDPDPLPGYAIAFFAPFTALPYRTAALLWVAVLVCSVAATAAIIAALTGLSPEVVAAILAYADGVISIDYGQIPPVLTCALAIAGYGVARGSRALTLLGASLSMIEPHVGVPACLALFLWRPALRPGLIAVAVVLVAASIALTSVPITLEYVRVELPTHAQAESTTSDQFSLAWLLHYAGIADATAIKLASAQYALMALAGIGLSGSIARFLRAPAAIALFPPAIAVIGGPYLHIQQVAAALPFALLAATRLRGVRAGVAWVAVALLALPWPFPTWRVFEPGAVAIVATVTLVALRNRRFVVAAVTAGFAALLYAGIAGPLMIRAVPALPRVGLSPAPPMPRAIDGDRLASEADAIEFRSPAAAEDFAISTPQTLAYKIPTWLALCALLASVLPGRRSGRDAESTSTRERKMSARGTKFRATRRSRHFMFILPRPQQRRFSFVLNVLVTTAIVLSIQLALICAVSAAPLVATVGQAAPAFRVDDLDGAPLSAKMLRGKPLYINVFATWCPPCRIELPEIVRNYHRYSGRITFLGIDEQEPAGKVAPFARAMGIQYAIGIDQGQMEASYRAHSVPTSIFIDRRGIVRALYRGPIPENLLQKYLRIIAAS